MIDISMFQISDLAVTVENAPEKVKKAVPNQRMQPTNKNAADSHRSRRRLRVGVNRGADYVKYLVCRASASEQGT
jgi:hypothetical protein